MMLKRLTLALLLCTSVTPAISGTVRLKDLVEFDGVRSNDLIGYGLVVGLNGTGDGLRNAPFTEELMSNMLERLGINVTGESLRPKNVAAVFVTAKLPPFARAGSDIDVTVSAIGDAKSLLGGTLVMTPLNAADGQVYAVAQGAIIAGGVSAEGVAASVTQGVPTAGTIPSGATIEREVDFDFSELKNLRLALRDADFTTALKIETTINARFGMELAVMHDAGTVHVDFSKLGGPSAAHLPAQSVKNNILTPAFGVSIDTGVVDTGATDTNESVTALPSSASTTPPDQALQRTANVPIPQQILRNLPQVEIAQPQQYEIELSPRELGHVKIIMIPTDTNMNVLISCERDETSILLRKNLDELTQDMHEIGYSNVNIEFGENSQNSSNEQRFGSQNHNQNSEQTTTPSSRIQVMHGSGVDLKI